MLENCQEGGSITKRTGSKEDPNKKVRKGKTTGEDLNIQIMARITNLTNRVWMFEGLPERWKEVVLEKKIKCRARTEEDHSKNASKFQVWKKYNR